MPGYGNGGSPKPKCSRSSCNRRDGGSSRNIDNDTAVASNGVTAAAVRNNGRERTAVARVQTTAVVAVLAEATGTHMGTRASSIADMGEFCIPSCL